MNYKKLKITFNGIDHIYTKVDSSYKIFNSILKAKNDNTVGWLIKNFRNKPEIRWYTNILNFDPNFCKTPLASVNGGKHPKGCAGAVWSNGNPSKGYCKGTSKNIQNTKQVEYYRKCCKWTGSKCVENSKQNLILNNLESDKNKVINTVNQKLDQAIKDYKLKDLNDEELNKYEEDLKKLVNKTISDNEILENESFINEIIDKEVLEKVEVVYMILINLMKMIF